MSFTRVIVTSVRAQFECPSGLAGRAVGWILASRPSNRRRNAWVVSLLEVQRHDRILEIGFGPGVAIREASRLAVNGCVCGVDHSEEMLRQAVKRNAVAIQAGVVDLRLGSADDLPTFAAPFDKILAINSLMFRGQTADRLRALRALLRPGGWIAIAHQPRGPGASDAIAGTRGRAIAGALAEAGFSDVRVQTLGLTPAVVCVLGTNPGDEDVRS